MKTISCSAHYGQGGLGQHFAQLVEDTRRRGELGRYYAKSIKAGDQTVGEAVGTGLARFLFRYTPIRLSHGWKNYLDVELFDRAVANRLQASINTFVGFAGSSLHSFVKAKEVGCVRLELVAPNSHVNNIARRHAQAVQSYPLERSWLNERLRRKTLAEYEMADSIQVISEYGRQTFVEEGVAQSKLVKMTLAPDARFVPGGRGVEDGIFRVMYVGSITVAKGIPVLLEAFSRLDDPWAQLTLVGGTATKPMRRYMLEWLRRDGRIRMFPSDPLAHLQQADVLVHPSWEDGFAYAPMEALACGVKVIVTEDTGMKEHVQQGETGYVVPTGDWRAILECLKRLGQAKRRVSTRSGVS